MAEPPRLSCDQNCPESLIRASASIAREAWLGRAAAPGTFGPVQASYPPQSDLAAVPCCPSSAFYSPPTTPYTLAGAGQFVILEDIQWDATDSSPGNPYQGFGSTSAEAGTRREPSASEPRRDGPAGHVRLPRKGPLLGTRFAQLDPFARADGRKGTW